LNGRVIFQNPDDRNDFIAAGCLADPDKCVIVDGSGVDLDHFTPAPMVDAPVFLMIARLLRSKGVLRLKFQVQHPEPAGHRMLRWTNDTGTSPARNVA
jgi:hypothetical protein